MKAHKLIINIVTAGLVVAATGSCSVMESISTKLPGKASVSAGSDGMEVKATTESAEKIEKEQKKAEERQRKAAEKKAAKEKKEAEKKAREQRKKNTQKKKAQPSATPAPSETTAVEKEVAKVDFTAGTWHLRSINGYTLSADTDGDDGERPYLIFEEATGRFYGNDGCNTVNGGFISQGDSLRFDNMLSTMRMCADAKYAQEFTIALDQTRTCKIVEDKAESILEFRNEKGKVLMTLARPAMEFLSGSWQVVKIDGHTVDSPDLKLVIDLPERRIHGNTGCNVLNGSIFIDPDKASVIQFQQIGVTMAMCPDAKWETPLLVALESVETVSQTDNNQIVEMLDVHGNTVLTLRPLPLNNR